MLQGMNQCGKGLFGGGTDCRAKLGRPPLMTVVVVVDSIVCCWLLTSLLDDGPAGLLVFFGSLVRQHEKSGLFFWSCVCLRQRCAPAQSDLLCMGVHD